MSLEICKKICYNYITVREEKEAQTIALKMSYDGTGHHVPKKMRFQLDAYCFLLYNIYTVKERKRKSWAKLVKTLPRFHVSLAKT